jgi:hypothetical protein
MALEDETIQLQRFLGLCRHHVDNYDPNNRSDIGRLDFVTELLVDRIDDFLKWIEKNGVNSLDREIAS